MSHQQPPSSPLSPEHRALLDSCADPSAIIDEGFRLRGCNAAFTARFSRDGKCPCGSFCYAVSHNRDVPCAQDGDPCPLTRARPEYGIVRALHVHFTADGAEHHEVAVRPLPRLDGCDQLYLEQLRIAHVSSAAPNGGEIVGQSRAFTETLELLTRVAPSDATVLLLGESGTGKEILAHAVHRLSPRANRPFVPVDCAGLSETLVESELFGHEPGAFTGAHGLKRGLVEAPRGGTLFLDEIGDIPLPIQVKLLRLIETRRVRRVGAIDDHPVDFRLVCATHRDLQAMVAAGTFRSDLYFRISAFPITIPPLRARRADVPMLVASFLRATGRDIRVSTTAMAALNVYGYPGNVRELRNILERACLLMDGDKLFIEHLPPEVRGSGTTTDADSPFRELLELDEIERRYLRWALGLRLPRLELAHRLGVSERTLFRRLRALRVDDTPDAHDGSPSAVTGSLTPAP